mmetsp:Transcript_55856/g.155733  ORF Transcript_55856/g.155733 Transcript_55856/m.155733 type:complete len:464 (-) Transcript_55856:344-1735(-)
MSVDHQYKLPCIAGVLTAVIIAGFLASTSSPPMSFATVECSAENRCVASHVCQKGKCIARKNWTVKARHREGIVFPNLDDTPPAPGSRCGNLSSSGNQMCRGYVEWAFKYGRKNGQASRWYATLLLQGFHDGITEATIDDFQRLWFCAGDARLAFGPGGQSRCLQPPCTCSFPPCFSCPRCRRDSDCKKAVCRNGRCEEGGELFDLPDPASEEVDEKLAWVPGEGWTPTKPKHAQVAPKKRDATAARNKRDAKEAPKSIGAKGTPKKNAVSSKSAAATHGTASKSAKAKGPPKGGRKTSAEIVVRSDFAANDMAKAEGIPNALAKAVDSPSALAKPPFQADGIPAASVEPFAEADEVAAVAVEPVAEGDGVSVEVAFSFTTLAGAAATATKSDAVKPVLKPDRFPVIAADWKPRGGNQESPTSKSSKTEKADEPCAETAMVEPTKHKEDPEAMLTATNTRKPP